MNQVPMKDTWDPNQYEKFKDQRTQPFFDLVRLVEEKPGTSIVDLGCGTGELTLKLHQLLRAKQTRGVDSSDEMLKKTDVFRANGLSFSKGDIETWNPPEKFDIIVSNAAIQWCSNHPQIFQNMREKLNPGGQIAVQMPMNHDYPTHVIATQMGQEEPWRTLLNESGTKDREMLDVGEYASLLHKLGYQRQNVFLKVYGHELESREGVIEWVKGTMMTYYQSRLRETDFQKFQKEFRERVFAVLPDEKPFFYPFKRILIWASL